MLSLYVHIPFCGRKCPYCGFYSAPYSASLADEFFTAIRAEVRRYRDLFREKTIGTIYIGGGTPTILFAEQLKTLCAIIRDHVPVSNKAEFTVEANPNSISRQKLDILLASGVNRLSIGVQSFSDNLLNILGRLHTVQEAIDSFRLARDAGFRNIGMDLIYGIPGQTPDDWRMSLEHAISCAPEHISEYSLSLDEGTLFTREAQAGRLRLPHDETVARMYEEGATLVMRSGYSRYEISNFSRKGFECRHNMHYWARGEYLGLGPSAWSFISGKRYSNMPDIREYCRRLSAGASPVEFQEIVGADAAAAETIMLRLRTSSGIDLQGFEEQHGRPAFERLLANSKPLSERNLVSHSSGRIRLTGRGILVSDDVINRLCS